MPTRSEPQMRGSCVIALGPLEGAQLENFGLDEPYDRTFAACLDTRRGMSVVRRAADSRRFVRLRRNDAVAQGKNRKQRPACGVSVVGPLALAEF